MDKLQRICVFIDHEAQKKPLIAKMRQSGQWTDLELLSLFPNNLLKRKGLPMQRDKNHRLSVQFVAKNWTLFEILEECVEELVGTYIGKPFFNEFVDVKNVSWGDQR